MNQTDGGAEDGTQLLLELGLDNLVSILGSDSLNLVHEETLIELVRQYIGVRDKVPKSQPLTAEQEAGEQLWALLTPEEQENRRVAF